MDDDKISNLLDRKRQKTKQEEKAGSGFFQLCTPGSEQMMTFRVKDGEQHLSFNYGYMMLCCWSKTGKEERLKTAFTTGWEIIIYGRGLESVHRALVSRGLMWVRGAHPSEEDASESGSFVREIKPVRSDKNTKIDQDRK